MGYGYVDLTSDELGYTIAGLTTGVAYTVHVSAINRHGQGARAHVASGSVTPPLGVPSAPTNVTVSTKGYNVTDGDDIGDSQARKKSALAIEDEETRLCAPPGTAFSAKCDDCISKLDSQNHQQLRHSDHRLSCTNA